MGKKDVDFLAEASDDAADFVDNFIDEVVEQLVESREASDDFGNDYPDGDSYHHETHVDKSYSLREAAELLDQLSNFEETDSGLWEGQPPREAISTQAAYTYGAAVYSMAEDIIKEINGDFDISDLLDSYEAVNAADDEDDAEALAAAQVVIAELFPGETLTPSAATARIRTLIEERVKAIIEDNR